MLSGPLAIASTTRVTSSRCRLVATRRVARIELQTQDGLTFESTLYPIAPGSIDATQAFLVLAPLDGVTGTVIAYDAAGNELQREHVSTTG